MFLSKSLLPKIGRRAAPLRPRPLGRVVSSQSRAGEEGGFPELVVVLSNFLPTSLPDCVGSESPHRFQRESPGREPERSWERSGGSRS